MVARGRYALLGTLLLAALSCLVFASDVFVSLERVRVKLVESPLQAASGEVRIGTGNSPDVRRLVPPFALIVRVKSSSPAGSRFEIAFDGRTICQGLAGQPGSSKRIDCVVSSWDPSRDHELVVNGRPGPWTLDYVEMATHHGHSTGANAFVILPRASLHYVRPGPLWTVITALLLLAIVILPPPLVLPRWARLLLFSVRALVAVLLGAVLLAPFVTNYRIVLPAGTFARWTALLFVPQLIAALAWLGSITRRGRRPVVSAARVIVVALIVFAVFGLLIRAQLHDIYKGNYSGFILISKAWFDSNPLVNDRDDVRRSLALRDDGGYDAQFMYFALFDPMLRAFADRPVRYGNVVDAPPYRFGRIGYGLLTLLFSAGRWPRYPATMMFIVLASLALLAAALALLARNAGKSAALGALVILVPGFWQSLQRALPEPVAAAALAGGLLFAWRGRWAIAGILFALSLLVRETGILLVASVLVGLFWSGRRREALGLGVVAVAPLFLWRAYVAWILFPADGIWALISHPPDLGLPFAGIARMWSEVLAGTYPSDLVPAALSFPVLLVAALVISALLAWKAPSPVTVSALLYALLTVSLNYKMIWVHVGNGQRGAYEPFVMLAFVTAGMKITSRSLSAGLIGFWCAAGAYVFWLGLDAEPIRNVLIEAVTYPLTQ